MTKFHYESIEALVIRCIDYRFVESSNQFKETQGWKNKYDLIAFPGASINIHQLFEAIKVSNRLHKPKKIVLIDHEDCGAFPAGAGKEEHVHSLQKARKLIEIEFPNLPVELYYNTFEGVEEIN